MCIFNYEENRLATCQLDTIDQSSQSTPPRVSLDIGLRDSRIGDAQQIVEQKQILRVTLWNLRTDTCPRGFIVETTDPCERGHHAGHYTERDFCGVGLTEC